MRRSAFALDFEFIPRSSCSIEGWGAAIIGAGALGAVGSAVAGGEEASGQEKAAQTQMAMFNTINQQEQPFLQAGYGATTALNQLLGTSSGSFDGMPNGYLTQTFNPTQQQLESYPGYQFQLQTGAQSVENAAAPGSGAQSGAALKQLMSFNQGTAASNYNNYFNQFQTQQNNIFSRLSSIAGLGQSAGAQVANSGTQLGTGVAQAQAAAAGSTAGGIVGATNALGGSANTLAGLMYLQGANPAAAATSTAANAGAFNQAAAATGWEP